MISVTISGRAGTARITTIGPKGSTAHAVELRIDCPAGTFTLDADNIGEIADLIDTMGIAVEAFDKTKTRLMGAGS